MSSSSSGRFSYQRLKHEVSFDENNDDDHLCNLREKVVGRVRSTSSRFSYRKVRNIRIKKPKIKISSLRRLFRKKSKMVIAAWSKVVKRLKESQSHFGDLFAGNYLFMQVTPTSLNYADKYLKNGHDFHGLSSRCSLPRVV